MATISKAMLTIKLNSSYVLIIPPLSVGLRVGGSTSPGCPGKNIILYFAYENGNIFNKDPLRSRKLLLHKKEINKLIGLTQQKGYTLVPISIYFKNSFVKLELGIAKGKKLYDKREDLAKKDAQKQIAINLKNKNY